MSALLHSPQFEVDQSGKPLVVRLSTPDYIRLLVEANIIDSKFWPPGYEQGAQILSRLRAIENECQAAHGVFDWELLSEPLQDEYDDLCAMLDQMQDTGERYSLVLDDGG